MAPGIWVGRRPLLKARNLILKADPTHVDYKSKDRMVLILMDAGFRVPRAVYAESHWPVASLAERLALRWVPLLRRRIGVVAVKVAPLDGGRGTALPYRK